MRLDFIFVETGILREGIETFWETIWCKKIDEEI